MEALRFEKALMIEYRVQSMGFSLLTPRSKSLQEQTFIKQEHLTHDK